jgi:glycerophosphoryl diester phosphodiesterase family protein
MPPETFSCPECHATLRYAPGLEPGAAVRCPKCQAQFAVPGRPRPGGATGEEVTEVPGRGRPRLSPPPEEEFSPTRGAARPAGPGDYADEDYPDRPLSGDYSIDLNRWFTVAGENYSAVLGPSVGFILLAGILTAVLYMVIFGGLGVVAAQIAPGDPVQRSLVSQVLTQLALLVLMPTLLYPLWSGMTAVYLAQVQGRPWTFGDFFSGFQRFGPLAGVGLASQLLGLVVSIPQLIVTFAAMQSRSPQTLLLSPLVSLVALVVVIFFQVRLFLFAPAIIFHRNLGAVEAIKANWKLTRGHFWGLFGISLLVGLVYLGGALACLVGLLFAIPYGLLILVSGYVLITGGRDRMDYGFRGDD